MASKNQRFLAFASDIIKSDRDHPLQFLLNEQGTRVMTHSGGMGNYYNKDANAIYEGRVAIDKEALKAWKSSDLADELGASVSVDACHMTTRKHGAQELFCIGIAEDNRASGHSEKLIEVLNDAIDISGVPVERRSAQKWESVGLLPEGTVANSMQSDGWSCSGETQLALANPAVLGDLDQSQAEMEAFMNTRQQQGASIDLDQQQMAWEMAKYVPNQQDALIDQTYSQSDDL